MLSLRKSSRSCLTSLPGLLSSPYRSSPQNSLGGIFKSKSMHVLTEYKTLQGHFTISRIKFCCELQGPTWSGLWIHLQLYLYSFSPLCMIQHPQWHTFCSLCFQDLFCLSLCTYCFFFLYFCTSACFLFKTQCKYYLLIRCLPSSL